MLRRKGFPLGVGRNQSGKSGLILIKTHYISVSNCQIVNQKLFKKMGFYNDEDKVTHPV